MVTLNPFRWQLPSVITVGRVWFSVVMALFLVGGLAGIVRGAPIEDIALAVGAPAVWFAVLFKDRLAELV